MFYSEAILSKKGPLAKVWLAAHWERKLSKNQFLQANLNNSVDAIMGTDQAPMALRLSGQLLLGVARIYSRKTKYLLEDCNEALVKIKVAFRSDANNKDTNLLMLDGDMGDVAGNRSKAAFNAITVPDAMTEFDLLMPAQIIDIDAWGLNPKLNQAARAQDINLEDGNEDELFTGARDNFGLDNGRRHLGLDIEVGRNQMNRIGGGGYSTMDFDLGGDDALDLDMFGDEVDFDFMKRPHRRDDLEIEVGRREATRRSVSVDPFAMMPEGAKDPMRLGSVERAPSVARSVEEQPDFQNGLAPQDRARSPVDFGDALDGEGAPAGDAQERQPTIKKRKLVVDNETEVAQELLLGANGDLVAEGLLIEHEMLPRSRKMLRLQQIEQDMAHGGLAGYLLDCSAGPRVMGGSMVPELASMFSRRLQIDQPAPVAAAQEGAREHWQDDNVGAWVDDVEPNEPGFGMGRMTPPPPAADLFDGFQLDSPQKDTTRGHADDIEDAEHGDLNAAAKGKGRSTLFQDQDDTNGPTVSTKELHGTVFSHSAIHTMRLVQQKIESKKDGTEAETRQRATRTTSMATASSATNRDNNIRVKFSELMEGPSPATQQRRTRTDAAKLFFELLVLSTKDVVKVEQEESFGDIAVGGSPLLDTLVEADTNTADEVAAAATTEVEVSA
ncbi:sister chromatid cohesion protein 1 [Linnemannia zychae]|nr:sister chromatid cohesion protein 1 [Linnemannia zychae]